MCYTKEQRKQADILFKQGLKKCSKCGKIKTLQCFSKTAFAKCGLRSECKKCSKIVKDINYKEKQKQKAYLFNKGLKKCCGCLEIKELSYFHKCVSSIWGLNIRCKDCRSMANGKFKSLKKERKALLFKGLKRCYICNGVKHVSKFYISDIKKDFLSTMCIKCTLKQMNDYHTLHKETILANKRFRYANNGKEFEYRKNNRLKIRKNNKKWANTKSYSAYYVDKINEENPSYMACIKDGVLLVKCYYDKKYFGPLNKDIQFFLSSKSGMGNMYCSDKCKQKCIDYNFHIDRIDPRSILHIEKSEQQKARDCQTNHLKQLQLDEFGYNYCEVCGAEELPTVDLHHTLEVAKFGLESINSAGHLLVCKTCHTKLTHQCRKE